MLVWETINIPTPFSAGSVNIYLILADPLTLIDTGPKTQRAEIAFLRELAARRLQVKDIKRVIITHGHVSHYGMAARIAEISGAKVYIHSLEKSNITQNNSFWDCWKGLFARTGVPEVILAAIDQQPRWEAEYADLVFEPLLVEASSVFFFDGFKLEVIYTPGHTPGHICLYEPSRGILFSGDHILSLAHRIQLEPPKREGKVKINNSLDLYLASLHHVQKVGASKVLPAHGSPVLQPGTLINQIISWCNQRVEEIYCLLVTHALTPYQIVQRLYPRINSGYTLLFAVLEVLVFLEFLEGIEKVISASSKYSVIYQAKQQAG